MMRYGIPSYRTPDQFLDPEVKRILDMGHIEVKLNTTVGKDISLSEIENEYDAVLWAIGCWTGRPLPIPNSDAPNCISAIQYLEAISKKDFTLQPKVVCVGGGDTSIDVVSSSRRLGTLKNDLEDNIKPENILKDNSSQDSSLASDRVLNEVTLTTLFPKNEMTATEEEVRDAEKEVKIFDSVMPLEVILDDSGRAKV